jgi:hypothetical protein
MGYRQKLDITGKTLPPDFDKFFESDGTARDIPIEDYGKRSRGFYKCQLSMANALVDDPEEYSRFAKFINRRDDENLLLFRKYWDAHTSSK